MAKNVLVFSANSLPNPVVYLSEEKTSIGRAPDCQISFPHNKLISTRHCDILQGPSGIVTLVDNSFPSPYFSTNGTIINGVKKLKRNEKVALNDGDVVYLVKKKSTKNDDVSFVFHAASPSMNDQTMAYTAELDEVDGDQTPPMVDDESVPDAADVTQQYAAHHSETLNGSTQPIVVVDDDDDYNEPPMKMPRVTRVADEMRKAEMTSARVRRRDSNELLPLPARLSRGSTLTQESNGSDQPAVSTNKESTTTTTTTDDAKTAKENDSPLPPVAKGTSADKPGPSGLNARPSKKKKNDDKMEEMLICTICCEIIHDCVSLTPCSHKFCAGCYSDWMGRSNECPVCRLKVDSIAKDYQFNAVIETYLQANPDKKRSPDDLKALDNKNKISADTIKQPKRQRRVKSGESNDSDEESDEYYSDDVGTDEEDDSDEEYRYGRHGAFGGQAFGFGGAPLPARFLCRSCPGYAAQPNARHRGPNVAQLASGEQYRCKPNQNHLLCQCCLEPIPDRRADARIDLAVKCQICSRIFCNEYWASGCGGGMIAGARCSSCLKKLSDMTFNATDMDGILLNNQFESDAFKTAIRDTPESDVNTLFSTCLKKVADDVFKLKYVDSVDTVVCKDCARKELAELAFQFRLSDVPNDRLPKEVTSRDDCWWGRNCTTQRKNPDHARRLNHICEQTRRH